MISSKFKLFLWFQVIESNAPRSTTYWDAAEIMQSFACCFADAE
jgi:hypothetical protein